MLILKCAQLAPNEYDLLPTKAYDCALGFDLYANGNYLIHPETVELISTGIACEFPVLRVWGQPDIPMAGLIRDRSGMATKTPLIVVAGVIDHDYRGEIKVALRNVGGSAYEIKSGNKIAQLLLIPTYECSVRAVAPYELSDTSRDKSGFGSTGK